MNKTELIEELAERTGSSKDEAQRRVEAFAGGRSRVSVVFEC